MGTCRLIIDNAIPDLANIKWAVSDKNGMARKIWPKLDRKRMATLLKVQRRRLSSVVGVIRGIAL